MILSTNIVKVFTSEFKILSSEEDFERFTISYQLSSIHVPQESEIDKLLSEVFHSDICTVYINIDDATDIIAYGLASNFIEFASALEVSIRGIEVESTILVKVLIEKNIFRNKIFIYALDNLKNYLNQFDVSAAINFFSTIIKTHGTITIVSSELQKTFSSTAIAFQPESQAHEPIQFGDQATREKRLRNIQSTTHAIALSDKSIIPEDFQFNDEPKGIFRHVLYKIEFALLIFAIADNSSIFGSELKFRLNGYKSIEGIVNLDNFAFENYIAEYRNIYNWIHESGNLTDKLGLSKNIISLHLNPKNDLSFTGNMFSSILSAYKVYEKQNIKQYIEVRNKMSDQLLDYNKRANTIVEGFASTFQKSALSVLTLFSSIVAVKILSTSAISSNFTKYSSGFAVVILFISFIYMLISRSDTLAQKKRYKKSYKHFKKRYSDLLNAEDIERILIGDKEFKADKAFIRRKIRLYTVLWAVVLATLFIFVIGYYYYQQ